MKGYVWVGWKRNSERNLIHKLLNNTQIRSMNASIDTQSLRYVPLEICRLPLGMQPRKIPDEALSTSSSFDVNTVGQKNSRIRTETNGGAWCPKYQNNANS